MLANPGNSGIMMDISNQYILVYELTSALDGRVVTGLSNLWYPICPDADLRCPRETVGSLSIPTISSLQSSCTPIWRECRRRRNGSWPFLRHCATHWRCYVVRLVLCGQDVEIFACNERYCRHLYMEGRSFCSLKCFSLALMPMKYVWKDTYAPPDYSS